MNRYPSPRELADEALDALRESPMTPRELWEFMIQEGLIDPNGRVLVNRLFGGNAADESNGMPAAPDALAKKESLG